jgi:hypothetical protein
MTDLVGVAPWVVLAAAALVFPVLFFITAPYGRHYRPGWGPSVPSRLGWLLMESPSVFLFAWCWVHNPAFGEGSVLLLGALWLVHYVQRTFVFSYLMKDQGKPKPVFTVALALVFNVLNAAGNGASLAPRQPSVSFVLGVALFVGGLVLNLHSDAVLRGLRAPGETGYKIPFGGGHRLVSAPNYLGEIIEWVGFALAAQTLAGWAFAAFTVANLVPRALANHRWYRSTFSEYPTARRALIPWVW